MKCLKADKNRGISTTRNANTSRNKTNIGTPIDNKNVSFIFKGVVPSFCMIGGILSSSSSGVFMLLFLVRRAVVVVVVVVVVFGKGRYYFFWHCIISRGGGEDAMTQIASMSCTCHSA